MVAAPFGYIGLAIALVLVGGVFCSVWILINKLIREPQKQITAQRAQIAGEEVAGAEKIGEEKSGEMADTRVPVSEAKP